ncbi:Hypothetical protein I595_3701 [Croceitalea dokdonensis DOKDO 023]|uniref:Uncharacterized protein n=1 Tax=Croceitalea dokdonensis DOKDO 023 TaxID=1300341 RepID=A0A0P7AR33_9FLAO|nr:Hypothetical protein I595_3701 [Croceitalea dokdonensis DOKDO 023]
MVKFKNENRALLFARRKGVCLKIPRTAHSPTVVVHLRPPFYKRKFPFYNPKN